MEKSFEYLAVISKLGNIDVKDIGNCIIKANTDSAIYYYLWIRTSDLGITRVCEFGPCIDAGQYLIKTFGFKYNKFNFTEAKCTTAIQKFLNNINYNITQATEITKEQLLDECDNIDIFKFMEDDYGN